MPQIISCPDCGRKLRVPDNLLGKKVKCPGCGVKFVGAVEEELEELEEVEAPPPPPRRPRDEAAQKKPSKSRRRDDEEEEEEDGAAKRKRREEDEEDEGDAEPQRRKPKKRDVYKGWERVRLGINLVAIAAWIFVCGYIALFVAMIVLGNLTRGAPAAQGFMAYLLLIWAGLVPLASLGAQLTGLGFCMGVVSAPRTQTLKVLAVAAFSMGVAILILQILSVGAARILGPNSGGIVIPVVFWSSILLAGAEALCFLFFMRGVAVVMRRDDLARSIVIFMITIGVVIGLSVVASVILMLAGMAAAITVAPSPGGSQGAGNGMVGFAIVGCLFMILALGVSLTLIIRFQLLVYQVRSAVDRWLDRN
jgi:hypothetical protein